MWADFQSCSCRPAPQVPKVMLHEQTLNSRYAACRRYIWKRCYPCLFSWHAGAQHPSHSLLPAPIKVDAHLETDGKLHPSHRTHCISEAGAVLALLMALVECFCRSLSTYPGRTSHGIGRWIFVAMSCRDIRTQSRKFSDDDRLLLHRVATYDGRTGYMLH